MQKVKIGIVGTGFISSFHYNGFQKNENAKVIGMCTHSNRAKLDKLCGEWGIKPYSGFEEMVSDPAIDALVIGSINPEHYPQILAAIQNGKHVLVEKPVVTDFGQLDQLEGALKESKTILFPGHNFVYRETVQKAKEIIDGGGLGKISYSSFISMHTIPEAHSSGWRGKTLLSSGGALMDSGHHQVYMSLYLMGAPEKIQAFKSNLILNAMEGEDIAQINLLYPDHSIGCIMQAWTSDYGGMVSGVKIVGDKGAIDITDGLYFNGVLLSKDVDYGVSFENQAKAFTDCILNGTKPISSLTDVRNTLKIIFGAYKSSDQEVVVSLDELS